MLPPNRALPPSTTRTTIVSQNYHHSHCSSHRVSLRASHTAESSPSQPREHRSSSAPPTWNPTAKPCQSSTIKAPPSPPKNCHSLHLCFIVGVTKSRRHQEPTAGNLLLVITEHWLSPTSPHMQQNPAPWKLCAQYKASPWPITVQITNLRYLLQFSVKNY